MKTLFRNARILKMDDTPIFIGDLVVDGNKIVYIGNDSSSYAPFDFIRECHQNVIMPSFKNAHSHSAMVFVRNLAEGLPLEKWLFDVVFPKEDKLIPSDMYYLSKLAFLEYLSSGITACFDQYFHSAQIARSAKDFGFRLRLLGTLPSSAYTIQDFENFYHEFNDNKGLVTFCLGLHAVYTVSDDQVKEMSDLCHKLHAPFYIHLCETETEVSNCIKKHNMSPVEYLESFNCFDYGGGGYHCVYFSDKDIDIFKKHNCSIVSCPSSNGKLASGMAPIAKYLDCGINVALGTDGPASNNSLDMFKEMNIANCYSNIITKQANSIKPYDLLKMATVNGAKAMELDDIDVLEVGKIADIIEIDLHLPNMQPINDVINSIVYSANKINIKLTMLDGNILYRDGKYFIKDNINEIYNKVEEISKRLNDESK